MSIKLHGKEYIEVKDRVQAAHAEESYSMLSEETFSMGGREYVRVYIDVKGKQYIGTAECKFGANPKTPDGMSPFECGETSALGRALGFAGYGIVESIASGDEVARNQDAPASNGHAEPDIVIDNLKARILKVQQRAVKNGIKTREAWAAFRKEYAGVDSDEQLTVVGLAKMDGELTAREKMPKAS